jgi:hypothetical protein
VPLTSSARQIYLYKRTRRAGGRRFRVGPDSAVATRRRGRPVCLRKRKDLPLAERLHFRSRRNLLNHRDSPPRRGRSSQCDSKRVATQDHESDQPPDCLLGVGVGADQLGDIADWRRFGLNLPPLGAQGGPFGFEVGKSGALTLALPGKRLAGLALLCDCR